MNTLKKYKHDGERYAETPEEVTPDFRPVRRKLLRAFVVTEAAGYSGGPVNGLQYAPKGSVIVQDESGNNTAMTAAEFAREFEYADVPAPAGFGTARPVAPKPIAPAPAPEEPPAKGKRGKK